MTGGFPECRAVLVLAAHPDDEALGCGGTLAFLNARGVSSTTVFMTDGERLKGEPSREIAGKRRTEGITTAALLGCEPPLFLGLPDGEVGGHVEDACAKLSEIIALKKPDFIFAPSPVDHHQDHLATADIALRLLEGLKSFRLAYFEVYSTVRLTHLLDITEVIGLKEKAVMNYRTSLYGIPEAYVRISLGLNAHRSLYTQQERYYEGFWILDRPMSREDVTKWVMYG